MRKLTSIASLFLFFGLLSIPVSTRAQTRRLTINLYAAKFVCGKSEGNIVAPGLYMTTINVHNAAPLAKMFYSKRFAIALPEEKSEKLSAFFSGTLEADQAMLIDCDNIYRHTNTPPGQFIEGYALLYSLGELDVVSVHTAGHSEVETINTERVPVRKFTIGRSAAVASKMLAP
ncbi:MAG: hypothetical protein QOJ64_523 [Acidobacteriota bacterium]|nr:hypothetical protein [Acidobacteriota bacterium]